MPALIVIHALAASFVILFGAVNIIRRRRDSGLRAIGRIYVVAMYVVCVSGMLIYSDAEFTIFHALAILNFSCVTIGVIAIRRRNRSLHAGMMIGSWTGTAIAGGFAAFVPGRAIPTLAAESPALLGVIVDGAASHREVAHGDDHKRQPVSGDEFPASVVVDASLDAAVDPRHREHVRFVEVLDCLGVLLLGELDHETLRRVVGIHRQCTAVPGPGRRITSQPLEPVLAHARFTENFVAKVENMSFVP